MRRVVCVTLAVALACPGCSLMMDTNSSGWRPSQPTTCSSSPAAPIADFVIGALLANVAWWAAVPHVGSAILGITRGVGCANAKQQHEEWLKQAGTDLLVQADDDDDDVDAVEAADRLLSRDIRVAEKAEPGPASAPAADKRDQPETSCAALVSEWKAEKDLARNAELFGHMPDECQAIALSYRAALAHRRDQAEQEAQAKRAAAARTAVAKRAAIAAELAEQQAGGDEDPASLERRAWQSLSARDRTAWTELPPDQREARRQQVLAEFRAGEEQRAAQVQRAELERRAWVGLTDAERAAWPNANARARAALKQRAIARQEQELARQTRDRSRREVDRRHRDAMTEEERSVWVTLSDRERRTGQLVVDRAAADRIDAQRATEDAEWRRLANAARQRREAEAAAEQRRILEEEERRHAADRVAEAGDQHTRAAEEKHRLEAEKAEKERQLREAIDADRRQREAAAEQRRRAAEAEQQRQAVAAEQRRRAADAEQRRKEAEAKRRGEAEAGKQVPKPGDRGGKCLPDGDCNGDLLCDPESQRCVGEDPVEPIKVEPRRPTGGYFIANTKPTARVWIDNRDTGQTTPIVADKPIPLAPGKHTVTFVTTGQMFTFEFHIKVGETTKLIKLLKVDE